MDLCGLWNVVNITEDLDYTIIDILEESDALLSKPMSSSTICLYSLISQLLIIFS